MLLHKIVHVLEVIRAVDVEEAAAAEDFGAGGASEWGAEVAAPAGHTLSADMATAVAAQVAAIHNGIWQLVLHLGSGVL
jgi:hypothetical protein